MFKVSKKTEYALRTLLELSRHYGKQVVSVEELSKTQKIPKNFLEQILLQLKGNGIVTSQRGQTGGYQLCVDPKDLTLAQIIRLTEGSWEFESGTYSKICSPCVNEFDYVLREVWSSMIQEMNHTLENISLKDLFDQSQRYFPLDYVI